MSAVVIVTFLLALSGSGLVCAVARHGGFMDHPDARSSHALPTPTGGGLGFIGALCATGWWAGAGPRIGGVPLPEPWLVCFLPLALGLCLLGFQDDRRGLPPWPRMLAHGVAAGVLLACLDNTMGWPLALLAVLFLAWTMNAYNFMDGSNGLAAGQGVFSGALLAWSFLQGGAPGPALAAASVAAACLAFLPWNAPRARLFMGDAGSVPLGFLLGGLALWGALSDLLPWPLVLLLLAPVQVDAGLTLLSRLLRGERWYTPHKRHVYQRLLAQGWTHGHVLLLYSALNGLVVAPAVMLGTLHPTWASGLTLTVLAVLSMAWYAVSLKLGKGT